MRILNIVKSLNNNTAADWRIERIKKFLEKKFETITINCIYPKLIPQVKNEKIQVVNHFNAPFVCRKLINYYQPDIVFANTILAGWFCILTPTKKIPLVIDMHGDLVEEYKFLRSKKQKTPSLLTTQLISAAVLKKASNICCVSHTMKDFLIKRYKIPPQKIWYIPNGVETSSKEQKIKNTELEELRSKLKLKNFYVVGYVGSALPWQGVENLIKASNYIKKKNIKILIVGGKNKKTTSCVQIIPRVEQEKVMLYYALCDSLILPRPLHTATAIAGPTKFAEYLFAQKPLIVTDVGDPGLLVKKTKCGYVCLPDKPKELARAIEKMEATPIHLQNQMAIKAKKLALKEYNWGKILSSLGYQLQSLFPNDR